MEIATALLTIIIFATLVQFLTDIVKGLLPDAMTRILKPPMIAALLGVALAVLFQVDIFAGLGFVTQYTLAAWIFTGLILSAGSSAVHELIAKLRESRTDVGDGGIY